MSDKSISAFSLVVDCGCGRRFYKRVLSHDVWQTAEALCVCGASLGAWDGFHSFTFEPEHSRRMRLAYGSGLSPH